MLKFKSKINYANNQSKALKVGLPKKSCGNFRSRSWRQYDLEC